jgi:hypothetical protein
MASNTNKRPLEGDAYGGENLPTQNGNIQDGEPAKKSSKQSAENNENETSAAAENSESNSESSSSISDSDSSSGNVRSPIFKLPKLD